jgi:hypothetical protein
VKVIVFDDLEDALPRAKRFLEKASKDVGVSFEIDEKLSARILAIEEEYLKRLDDIRHMAGEALFFIDLGFYIAANNKSFAEKLCREYQIPSEIEPGLRDGTACVVEIIRNLNITRALIILNTGRRKPVEIDRFLKSLLQNEGRERDIMFDWARHALGDSDERAKEVVEVAVHQSIKFLAHHADPVARFYSEVSHVTLEHPYANNIDDVGKLDQVLSRLLSVPADQIKTEIREKTDQQALCDAFKTMGIMGGRPFAASAAWLVALGAYRHADNQSSWQAVFDPVEISEGLSKCFLLPNQKRGTIQQSIRYFFEMCVRLFTPEIPQRPSLLRRVELNRESLRFELEFPCTKSPRSSLFGNLAACRSLALQGKPSHGHGTSTAIWNFWLASSLTDEEDFGFDEEPESAFGTDVWRINIQPLRKPNGDEWTEVIFC